MADIINLRVARKRKARSDKEIKAEQNRQKFGQTKAKKQKTVALDKLSEQHLDAHKLDD